MNTQTKHAETPWESEASCTTQYQCHVKLLYKFDEDMVGAIRLEDNTEQHYNLRDLRHPGGILALVALRDKLPIMADDYSH